MMCNRTILLTALAAFFAAGCNAERAQAPKVKDKTLKITAHLAFRPTQNAKFEQRKITVHVPVTDGPIPEIARNFPPKELTFPDMKVVVRYDVNSLIVTVSDKTNNKQIYRNLYQFGPKLRNQFHGGHGFTGLSYIDHPASATHLQFWCTVENGQ